jgi:hypothetical protein
MFNPGDKVVVCQLDGTEFRGVVVLTEVLTSGSKVRVRSGDFILNVDERQVAKDDGVWLLTGSRYVPIHEKCVPEKAKERD